MRIKVNLRKDRDIRSQYTFLELKIRALKILNNSGHLNYLDSVNNVSKLRLNINNLNRVKNKCFLTSRNRGLINRNMHLSRIKIKELGNMGILLGFKKHSW